MTEPPAHADEFSWSAGHFLALEQLTALAESSDGAVQVLRHDYSATARRLDITVSVRLDLPSGGAGIDVRAREKFVFLVGESFPFSPPTVQVSHRRWARTPHVQWARQLCLYAAPSTEWVPAEGMRGLVERLVLWLERAAAGTLDADGVPMHPPVAYPDGPAGTVVVRADLGALVPWQTQQEGPALLVALCTQAGERLDIVDWMAAADYQARVLENQELLRRHDGTALLACPVAVLPADIGFEFPRDAAALLAGLGEQGLPREELLVLLSVVAHGNVLSAPQRGVAAPAEGQSWPHGPGGVPQVLLVGTPSREVVPGRRVAHLVGWRIDDTGGRITDLYGSVLGSDWDSYEVLRDRITKLRDDIAKLGDDWLGDAEVKWLRLFEDRAETTLRRDQDSAANWLRDKRVLVLGCGALGAPIAEMTVRAGARTVTVVDNVVVTPGILVRQPYDDADIGQPKAQVLADRLRGVRAGADVVPLVHDALNVVRELPVGEQFDLIVDATADAGLRSGVERQRSSGDDQWPPLLTMLVGHHARRGLVAISRGGASGAGHDVLRRIAIAARTTHSGALADIADDLYPLSPRTDVFLPEPGCSAPTFTGSQVEAAALAADLYSAGLDVLMDRIHGEAAAPMAAAAIRLAHTDTGPSGHTGITWLGWPNDLLMATTDGTMTVRLAVSALTTIRAEVRRGARLRGADVETGGMLLGALDEATGVVHVDVATPPAPDSRCSSVHFEHGLRGSQDLVDHYVAGTGRVSTFVGMWHTHPQHEARPSPTDEAGMANLVTPVLGGPPRSLMLIIGGAEPAWRDWSERPGGATAPPEVYARIVRRTDRRSPPPPQPAAPPGRYWLAGEPIPARGSQPWWRRWLGTSTDEST